MSGDPWHALSSAEVAARLNVDFETGLSPEEASRRAEQYGPNALPEKGGPSLLRMIGAQFTDVVIWVLLVATGISAALGEVTDAVVIAAIVVLNTTLSVVQEWQAERSLVALKQLAAPLARLRRAGEPVQLPAREIVPGDILLLEAGSRVPADARLLESVNLSVDESALTGESQPAPKDAAAISPPDQILADRSGMVYMGTTVTRGRGMAIAVATGLATELGQIAGMVVTLEKEKTPLQVRLEDLGRRLALGVVLICVVVFLTGTVRGLADSAFDLFLTAVSLAVAAIPEGLPAVVTIVLALGMRNMVRRGAIVRSLRAVEALGSTTVICTDKTGTLTANEMTVRRFLAGDTKGEVTGEGYEPKGEFIPIADHRPPTTDHRPPTDAKSQEGVPAAGGSSRSGSEATLEDLPALLRVAVLCNDARLVEREGRWQIVGDPTEGALIVAAAKAGLEQEALAREMPRRREIPFDSERKRMATVHELPGSGRFLVCVKGSPGGVLERCSSRRVRGREEPLTSEARGRVLEQNEAFADAALRVLAFAYRELDPLPERLEPEELERDLVFAGLLGMFDPPRAEAKPAVERCFRAGIRPVMVTGDQAATARAVAGELGLAADGFRVLTGAELQALSPEALAQALPEVAVFARVSPADKLRLVEAYRAAGQIVAMTGDGVNDAPALRRADIGVAMGITGTDAAKEAADMVLTDDNFASIVAAVEEGRGIFDNIRKFVIYLLSCNLSEVLVIFLSLLFGLPRPLLPVQILWVNLVTDGLPALALGLEPKEARLMERPPRDPESGLLDRESIRGILWHGICLTAVALLAFLHGLYWYGLVPRGYETFSEARGVFFDERFWAGMDLRGPRTLAFATLALAQLMHAFNCRSETRSLFSLGLGSNPEMLGAVGLSLLSLLAVIYVPFLQAAFDTVPVTGRELAVTGALSLVPLAFGEVRKGMRKWREGKMVVERR